MATITDQLVTTLVLTGVDQYVAELSHASNVVAALAAREVTLAEATQLLKGSFLALGIAVGVAAAAVGAITKFVSDGIGEFAKQQDQIFRAGIAFANLGSSLPFEEFQQFASELERITSVDADDIVELGGALLRVGVAGDQLEATTRAVVNLAEGTGQSLESATGLIESALIGRATAINKLGVAFKATGDRAADVLRLTQAIEATFGGSAEARRNSLPGTIDALKVSFGNFMEAIGNVFAPLAITALNQLKNLLDFLTAQLVKFARFEESLGLLPSGAVDKTLEELRNRAALQGDKTNGYLGRIEKNTAETSAAVRQILGGPGSLGPRSASIRVLRDAFSRA